MPSPSNLDIYKRVRLITKETLKNALQKVLKSTKSISESDLKNAWLKELRKNKSIFPNGWYVPPPNGVVILFATDKKPQRTLFRSLRFKEYFARKNIFLDKNKGIIVAYASPVHKQTGIIGDFGLTLYFGKSKAVMNHFKKVLKIQHQIYRYAKVGMTFTELYRHADNLFNKSKLSNDWWVNVTDQSGRNFGHTIPATEKKWSNNELHKIHYSKSWKQVADLESERRIFVSPMENFKIKNGVVFSIEPRLKSIGRNDLPMVWFHTVVVVGHNGRKEFLTDFSDLFNLVHMDYMK
ncbi:hypothetical protein A2165_02395 [Candidatus Curtissbacteria bacterium RBG_13_40_7]|uniref:Peptidase M24 domain-containing protein n=1 Tax=Candidatus Curtissbacteria bacterium RBG_13_40_7 TaxID=1797706 RepID=A0A1F5FUX5_9BACT|nr:MAG: hypothetical protein A2165_02395 [Candidatus Curtissbacteria bacterium RBG_13_40_7]